MRLCGGVTLAILVLTTSAVAAADSPTILRVSPISVPGAANGRHFSVPVTADLSVASRADAETLCRWMPRVRDTILRNVDFKSVTPPSPGAELPATTCKGIRKAINRAVGTDLVRAVHMHQAQVGRRARAENRIAPETTTCRQLGFE